MCNIILNIVLALFLIGVIPRQLKVNHPISQSDKDFLINIPTTSWNHNSIGANKVVTEMKLIAQSRNLPCVPAKYVGVPRNAIWTENGTLYNVRLEAAEHSSAQKTIVSTMLAKQVQIRLWQNVTIIFQDQDKQKHFQEISWSSPYDRCIQTAVEIQKGYLDLKTHNKMFYFLYSLLFT